jgi:hypothetical protein
MTFRARKLQADHECGVALVLVLAFVVLLTVLVTAYFSRTTTERQTAAGSLSQVKADELARSALDVVVGDFMQEIANGSTPPTGANINPSRSGDDPAIPNLVRRSVRADSMPAPGIPSRASSVSSADPAIGGRFVSASRWNSHFLVPKADLSNDEPEPIAAFAPPDWVLVSRNGPSERTDIGSGTNALSNSSEANADYVIGRYAYAVYDEGGLLDINVAGYPAPTPAPTIAPTIVGRKGTVAFADLTALPTTASSFVTNTAINRLIGWRNYATVQPTGSFPAFTFSTAALASFVTRFLDRSQDFLRVSQTATGSGPTQRTDQAFMTRSELIQLRSSLSSGAASMLQFLGTFSRERNKPTWNNSATLLGSRWPLSRFDLFASLPPNASDAALIQQYFGLVYVPPSDPTIPEHWQYNGTTGGIRQSGVPILGGGANQDPELFALLKYALPTAPNSELLSIGASLIDQRDVDTNTTWIEFGDPTLPAEKAFGADSVPPPIPTDPRPPTAPVMLKRYFRNVGELGYAYRNASTTLDFWTSGSSDAPLLDLFTYNTAAIRAGSVNLNTRNPHVLAAILKGALPSEFSTSGVTNTNQTTGQAITAANSIIMATTASPAVGRQDVARLANAVANSPFTANEEAKETIARTLAELGQTRTWGLFVDVIAQSGRYPPTAANLTQFVVQGEKRYWLHVAIDRFTGEVIDQQLEAVYE